MNTDDRPATDDRPQGQFTHFGKISNGHNSAMRQPIPFVFGSRDQGEVFGDGRSNSAISGWIKFKMAAGGHLGKLQTAISNISATHYPIHCMYVRRPYFALGH